MPRTARKKSFDSIYHVMIRSISEIILFKDNNDKGKYLSLIKRYQLKFDFKVYCYCLMNNHAHFIIDANGADISKFMHGINQCYAQYFNKKYERHGHVFQDRFKSKIVDTNRYLYTLSAYIHKNPTDIKKYQDCVQKYKFSSLGVYLGLRKDNYKILDQQFITNSFKLDSKKSKQAYQKLVYKITSKQTKNQEEFSDTKTEYRSGRVIFPRNYTPQKIVDFVTQYTKINKKRIFIKYDRKSTTSKALCSLLMRRFCNYSHKDICKTIGNLTQARISKLCSMGVDIITENKNYQDMINKFIHSKAS